MDNATSVVKAVGFSFLSPEVVLIMADTSANRLHFYPSASDGKALDLSESKPHWVLLKSPDHIGSMSSYADRIDRLIVFGRPDELLNLGLPIMDANVSNGQVEVIRRSSVKDMLERIQQEAIDLSLAETEKIYQGLKHQEKTKMKSQPSGRTFVQQLRELKAAVGQANAEFNFIQQIGVPAVLRLLGDTDREEFKRVCKLMVDKGGVPDTLARSFFRWVEGFDGEGTELGKAAEKLLYPQEGAKSMRTEAEWQPLVSKLASKMQVNATDLEFVARSYFQLAQERQTKEPEAEDGDWKESASSAPPVTEGVEQEDETEEPVDAPSDEGDEADPTAFGWSDEAVHPSRREPDKEADDEGGMFGQDFGDFDS